jgi:hypothetical protein
VPVPVPAVVDEPPVHPVSCPSTAVAIQNARFMAASYTQTMKQLNHS